MAVVKSETYKSLRLDELGKKGSRTPAALLNLTRLLEISIQKNEQLITQSPKKEPITVFHGTKAPDMSIRQYIERIFKYCSCSPCCFVIAYVYIEKLFQQKGGYLTSLNAHRLLITGVMVAAKFVDDVCHNNAYFAKLGGLSIQELNRLELELLFSLNFRLFITKEVFEKYCEQLDKLPSNNGQISSSMNPLPRESRSRRSTTANAPKIASSSYRHI